MKSSSLEAQNYHAEAVRRLWVDAFPTTSGGGAGSGGTSFSERENDSGGDFLKGDVVVLQSDGTVATTTTAQSTGQVGVVLEDIADGDRGPVAWAGAVPQINTTGAVPAGDQFAETSTTPGSADISATRRSGSFAQFTGTGSNPPGYLFGAGAATGTTAADTNIWRPVMAFDGTNWYVTVDGTGQALMAFGPA